MLTCLVLLVRQKSSAPGICHCFLCFATAVSDRSPYARTPIPLSLPRVPAAALKVSDDIILALGAATMLLLLGQAGCDPLIFAKADVATLVTALLEASFQSFSHF